MLPINQVGELLGMIAPDKKISFDKIYVEEITEKGLIIRFEEETEKKFYDYNLLKEVTVSKDEDYDKQFE